MQQLLILLQAIHLIMPLILDAFKIAETAFPESGTGQAKLEAARVFISENFNKIEGVTLNLEQLWPQVQTVLNAIAAGKKLLKA
ncbi:hypothetical protein QN372_00885 [Undibacterium sp. RTI2.1]|uniref:hypothetical protein n=1 Tax=unclassified Undibacterium TaxID=2630295 RepID=UPI002AB32C04|nr:MULTISPECIES: hypothetical protein [unclassified Undibacterium]MDY7537692.1 hypothetical protein [Undibacterium sp. 5I1]MEB0029294.1 hypothetical protein [Undibacterium sp. RTI2.1]MEB0115602.1 hypothetical protein [Undibacterium sp. RTI2.2]MEB0256429.1 hypothetical protein [Undibacterium sp. 5I1]